MSPLARYLLKRLLSSLVTILGVTIVVFLILHLTPGDPARLMLPDSATEADIKKLRHELGLNQPLTTQYAVFLKSSLQGEMGRSLYFRKPSREVIIAALPATLELSGAALVLAVGVGVPLGVVAAARRGSAWDLGSMFLALLGQSMSPVWLGLLLIYVFAVATGGMLPAFGRGTLRHLILPAVTLGAPLVALLTRMTRAGMVEVLREDYVRTARAKGVAERVTIYKHALKNTLIPLMTLIGMQLGTLLGGAVITESIFAWPGIGRLAMQAISGRDFPLVQGLVLVSAVMVVAINLVVDLLYAAVDPRLRYA